MKLITIPLVLLLSMCSTPSFAATEYTVSKPTVIVYEKNHGKGRVKCELKQNTKVQSSWDKQTWALIESKYPKCKGWVEIKHLKG